MHLTKRQKEIYEYLKEYISSKGFAPSIVEICKNFQLRSPATVHKHLSHLEKKKQIRTLKMHYKHFFFIFDILLETCVEHEQLYFFFIEFFVYNKIYIKLF